MTLPGILGIFPPTCEAGVQFTKNIFIGKCIMYKNVQNRSLAAPSPWVMC